MNRSSQPQPDGEPRRATRFVHTADELLRRFHDISTLGDPSEVCVYYQTTQATIASCEDRIKKLDADNWQIEMHPGATVNQVIHGMTFQNRVPTPAQQATFSAQKTEIADLEGQVVLLRRMRRACAERMLALMLGVTGRERRMLYRRFKMSLRDTWPYGEQLDELRILKQAPLWLYWGSWK